MLLLSYWRRLECETHRLCYNVRNTQCNFFLLLDMQFFYEQRFTSVFNLQVSTFSIYKYANLDFVFFYYGFFLALDIIFNYFDDYSIHDVTMKTSSKGKSKIMVLEL